MALAVPLMRADYDIFRTPTHSKVAPKWHTPSTFTKGITQLLNIHKQNRCSEATSTRITLISNIRYVKEMSHKVNNVDTIEISAQ
jgi:hypothetical protein